MDFLGLPSPFFPGILLSRKPPETRGKRFRLKRVDKESTPTDLGSLDLPIFAWSLHDPSKMGSLVHDPIILRNDPIFEGSEGDFRWRPALVYSAWMFANQVKPLAGEQKATEPGFGASFFAQAIFDAPAGEIFAVRNAGNSCAHSEGRGTESRVCGSRVAPLGNQRSPVFVWYLPGE